MENTGFGQSATVERVLDSTLESVDESEALAVEMAETAGFDEDARLDFGMAVREAAINAVVHGNAYSAHKKVRISVETGRGRIRVKIRDEGGGLDLEGIPDPLAEPNILKQSGRGILLIRAFVDEFVVERAEPSGTQVTLTKYLQPPESVA